MLTGKKIVNISEISETTVFSLFLEKKMLFYWQNL